MAAVMGFRNLTWGTDLFRRYPGDMAASAAQALIAGNCRYVVGLRALYNLQGRSYATSEDRQAYGYDQFTRPYGFPVAGTRFATRAQRYMARHGLTRTDLYEVVALATLNPDAVFHRRPLELEACLEAPMVASPHGLFDCDMPVCGAAAFVMCRAEDLPARARPAWVTGWAGFQTPHRVFERAGLGPGDMVSAQLYDGFSTMLCEWLEGFGAPRRTKSCPPILTKSFVSSTEAEHARRTAYMSFCGFG